MRGLLLCGTFVEASNVTRGNGTPVEGFLRVVVDVGPEGIPFPRSATYSALDRDTGEPTPAHRAVEALRAKLKPGVKVLCGVTARADGKYVNYALHSIELAA
jgi:hypothetical protein